MATRDNTLLWALLGAGGVAALYAFRGGAARAIGVTMDAVQEGLFRAIVPSVAKPYADVILQVAREQGISPFLITQLGYRESLWGNASQLDQPGPGGRGDNGHGHGLMQIDDGTNAAWLAAYDWTDPYTNVSKGVEILKKKIAFLSTRSSLSNMGHSSSTNGTTVMLSATDASRRGVPPGGYTDPRPLTGDELMQAAVAAYNTGEANVLMSIAAGVPVDVTTASSVRGGPGDYSNDVLTRTAQLISLFNTESAAV